MASTSASESAEVGARAKGNPARGAGLRYLAIALMLAAIAGGVMLALWGEASLPIVKLGALQAKSIAWAIPAIATVAVLFTFGYPRVGATVSLFAAIVAQYEVAHGGQPLSNIDRTKLRKYAAAYRGSNQALVDKYLATIDAK